MSDLERWLEKQSYSIRFLALAFDRSHEYYIERLLEEDGSKILIMQFGSEILDTLRSRIQEDAKIPLPEHVIEAAREYGVGWDELWALFRGDSAALEPLAQKVPEVLRAIREASL